MQRLRAEECAYDVQTGDYVGLPAGALVHPRGQQHAAIVCDNEGDVFVLYEVRFFASTDGGASWRWVRLSFDPDVAWLTVVEPAPRGERTVGVAA